MACPPSARLEALLPEPKRKPGSFNFSEEGTTAHKLAEAKLRRHYGQISAKEYIAAVEEVKATPYYDEEFEKYVDDYVLYVRSQIGEGDTPYFEQRVDFSEWVPDGFGTADVVILSETKVRVIDLKFGKGVAVDAKDNPQLRLYALGGWYKYKEAHPNITEVEYTIHQPRLESITTDGTTLDKLLEWAEHVVKPKAKKAWAGAGDFLAGDHCQFCKAKAQCSEAELAKVLSDASRTRKWLKDVEEFLLERAETDGVVPTGYQLGLSSKNRVIEDTEKAAVKLRHYGDDVFEPRTLKSVAQLEKVVGKDELKHLLGELIIKPVGDPKLVPVKKVSEFEG
jgi:hypothetical protein